MKILALCGLVAFSLVFSGGCAGLEQERAEQAKFRDQMRASMASVMEPVIVEARATANAKLKPMDQMFDPKIRDEAAVEAVPALEKLTTLLGQQADLTGDKYTRIEQINMLGLNVMMGDEGADRSLEELGQNKADIEMATRAKMSRLTGYLWRAKSDPVAQMKIVEQFRALAKSDPKNDRIYLTLKELTVFGTANESVGKAIMDIAMQECTGNAAMAWKAIPDKGKVISFKGVTIEGEPIDLEQYRGKVVVLSFWATWCPWCVKELPAMAELYKQEKDNGLVIIGVLTEDAPESMVKFRLKHSTVTWPVVPREMESLEKEYGVSGLPSKLIIDRDGKVVTMTGMIKGEELANIVRPLLHPATQPASK